MELWKSRRTETRVAKAFPGDEKWTISTTNVFRSTINLRFEKKKNNFHGLNEGLSLLIDLCTTFFYRCRNYYPPRESVYNNSFFLEKEKFLKNLCSKLDSNSFYTRNLLSFDRTKCYPHSILNKKNILSVLHYARIHKGEKKKGKERKKENLESKDHHTDKRKTKTFDLDFQDGHS